MPRCVDADVVINTMPQIYALIALEKDIIECPLSRSLSIWGTTKTVRMTTHFSVIQR